MFSASTFFASNLVFLDKNLPTRTKLSDKSKFKGGNIASLPSHDATSLIQCLLERVNAVGAAACDIKAAEYRRLSN